MAVVFYPRLATPDRLQVWVGVDATQLPALAWRINGASANPRAIRAIEPARPANLTRPDEMRVFTGIYEFDAQPATTYRVGAGSNVGSATRMMRTPPVAVPQYPSLLRMLLLSCYHRPEDKIGAASAIAQVVREQPPDLSLFLGDQVYLDLPTLRNFRDDPAWLARKFEKEDYGPNWFGPGGLTTGLAAAPAVFTPDDHEYWNNYPHAAPHIQNVWSDDGQQRWRVAAQHLWTAFQQAGGRALGDAVRHDVEPIALLVLDSRSVRRKDRSRTFSDQAIAALRQWRDDVINRRWLGIVVTGQSIFQTPKRGLSGRLGDWHLSNYGDYAVLVRALRDMIEAGRSVLCLTGDVHWGRILWGKHIGRERAIGEIVSSPLSLVTNIVGDTVGRWWQRLTGSGDPVWPRHSNPPDDADADYPAEEFGGAYDFRREHPQKGDQIVTMSFGRVAPQTLDLSVTFTPIHATQRAVTRGPFRLRL